MACDVANLCCCLSDMSIILATAETPSFLGLFYSKVSFISTKFAVFVRVCVFKYCCVSFARERACRKRVKREGWQNDSYRC
jgi:hypothetical protein